MNYERLNWAFLAVIGAMIVVIGLQYVTPAWLLILGAVISLALIAVVGWLYVYALDRAKVKRPAALELESAYSYRVTCSCGKSAVIVWAPSLDRYVAQTEGWIFGDHSWTCGEQGHRQRRSEILCRMKPTDFRR